MREIHFRSYRIIFLIIFGFQEMEKERQARLGPGGLDPVEVFESLPKVSTD